MVEKKESFAESFKGGWAAITAKPGIFMIIVVSAGICLVATSALILVIKSIRELETGTERSPECAVK